MDLGYDWAKQNQFLQLAYLKKESRKVLGKFYHFLYKIMLSSTLSLHILLSINGKDIDYLVGTVANPFSQVLYPINIFHSFYMLCGNTMNKVWPLNIAFLIYNNAEL